MGAAPVAHDQAVEPPFLPQQIGEKPGVLAAIRAVQFVVRAHHCPGAAFLDGQLERQQVQFAQRTFGNNAVDGAALELRLVAGEVLDGRRHTLTLKPLDVGDGKRAGQQRVLRVAFEIAAIERAAEHIHGGAQQRACTFVFGFPRKLLTDFVQHLNIPRRPERNANRKGGSLLPANQRTTAARPSRAVGHFQGGNIQARDCDGSPEVRTGKQRYLLLKRQLV